MHELFRPIHPNARAMHPMLSRVAAALAVPYRTSYVAPQLVTIDALLYAVRGYDVYWTYPKFDESDEGWDCASAAYRIHKVSSHGERSMSHGIGLSSVFPGWAHGVVCDLRNAMARRRGRRIGKAAEARKVP